MKILVGYDGSKPARRAIDLALEYAKVFKAQVVLVTSLVGGAVSDGDQIHHAEEEFETIKQLFDGESIPFATDLLIRGLSPGEDIVQYAKENKVDQIILGVKKMSLTGKLIFGSNAQRVILNAHCPVVTVK